MGTTNKHTDVPDVAARLIASIEAADGDGFLACFAPGAVIWHNNDNLDSDPAQSLKVLGWLRRRVDRLRYEEIRVQPTPAGYVEQHVLRGTRADGLPFEVPARLVVAVEDGLITRLDEYVDASGLGAL